MIFCGPKSCFRWFQVEIFAIAEHPSWRVFLVFGWVVQPQTNTVLVKNPIICNVCSQYPRYHGHIGCVLLYILYGLDSVVVTKRGYEMGYIIGQNQWYSIWICVAKTFLSLLQNVFIGGSNSISWNHMKDPTQSFFRNLLDALRSHDAQFPWWRALQAAPDLGRILAMDTCFFSAKGSDRRF